MEKVPLTPNKIQRLMYLAEDKSFNARVSASIGAADRVHSQPQSCSQVTDKSNYESSGLLDLDDCEEFGESSKNRSLSMIKSTTFYPGEMTGRSTGADDESQLQSQAGESSGYNVGRQSTADLYNLEQRYNKQSEEVQEIVRQSICSGMTYSFHSKANLTADEASLVGREAPVPPSQINMDLKENTILDPAEASLGAYFQTRCDSFSKMISRSDSPHYDVSELSIVEDPPVIPPRKESNQHHNMTAGLDSVPVKQPRSTFNIPGLSLSTSQFKPISPAKGTQTMEQPSFKNMAQRSAPIMTQLLLDPSRQHLRNSLRQNSEESTDESVNISTIQSYLGKESNIDVAQMMKALQIKTKQKKHPLDQVDVNTEENRNRINPDTQVTYLKDTKKAETASSAGTVNTIIDAERVKSLNVKSNQENEPCEENRVRYAIPKPGNLEIGTRSRSRSKSPSSKSHSTLSTVKENLSSFKSSSSPVLEKKGEVKTTNIPSPNVIYKELDKSVDWQEIFQMTGQPNSEGMAKVSEDWVDISMQCTPITGIVGVNTKANIALRSFSESWLTVRFEFNLSSQSKDLTIDLPRFPILLPPGETEYCSVNITSAVEMSTTLSLTFHIKDSCIDEELIKKKTVEAIFKMPVFQSITGSDKKDLVTFRPIQEEMTTVKSFILFSDCPADLQLELSINEGKNVFSVIGAQEISRSLMSKHVINKIDDKQTKLRGLSKQLCKLSPENVLKITVMFLAPKLEGDNKAVISGALTVKLIGINVVLKRIELMATVGTVNLRILVNHVSFGKEPTSIPVTNTGSLKGTWAIGFGNSTTGNNPLIPFKLYSNRLEIEPGATAILKLSYTGPMDDYAETTLAFEEASGKTSLRHFSISGGKKKAIQFPIKTSSSNLSWVREGRKEISMKNIFNTKIHIKCKIIGEGFYLDLPRSSGPNVVTMFTFGPLELRTLPVKFDGSSNRPCVASLYMHYEKNGEEISRKIYLYGCASGDALSWLSNTITMGVNAQVRALPRHPIELKLKNKSAMPSFLAASVRFNLTYRQVEPTARLTGARRVVPGRDTTTVTLHVNWAKVEKTTREAPLSAAPTLATITVFTGAEITRKRILKLLNKESVGQGKTELDVSSLPDNLKLLAGPFEGEDAFRFTDDLLKDFDEPESSLEELLGGIQELSAQVDLAQGFEDNTILITDDTVLEHHTLPAP